MSTTQRAIWKDKKTLKLGLARGGRLLRSVYREVYRASERIGQFFMNFGPEDRHVARGVETKFYLISVHRQYRYFDVLANENAFTGLSFQNQHA